MKRPWNILSWLRLTHVGSGVSVTKVTDWAVVIGGGVLVESLLSSTCTHLLCHDDPLPSSKLWVVCRFL
jgi:hypothetical protein